MKVILHIQHKRGVQIERPKRQECDLTVDRGTAEARDDGDHFVAGMERVQIDFVSGDGMMLSGVEKVVAGGRETFYYQRWWVTV